MKVESRGNAAPMRRVPRAMPLVRRLASVLALVLVVLVGGQATDVWPCDDEGTTEATGCTDAGKTALDADCVCHLVYAPTAAPLPTPVRSWTPWRYADGRPVRLIDGAPPPLVRPPIG